MVQCRRMEIITIILAVLLLVTIVFLFLQRGKDASQNISADLSSFRQELLVVTQELAKRTDDSRREVQTSVDKIRENLESGLRHSQNSMQQQGQHMQETIMQIIKDMTEVKETNKQVLDYSAQLTQLSDILKNPKQRGVLGEYYLETLLKNVLPPGSYQMQYSFEDGEIVDAIVRIKDKLIPIDSKFSLENYNRLAEEKNETERARIEKLFVNDLKLRIQETAKYIRPQEGTMDFAFMFIPHEAIYYDLLVNKVGAITEDTDNLIQRAANKYKVIIVSPTSFLAYLQTVLQGLKAMQIEETAKDIIQRVGELGKHLKAYEEYHNKLGNNLSTVVNQYVQSSKELKKIDKDVMRITGVEAGLDPVIVDKPMIE
jgi:DNA recombination protein RmuC